MTPLLAGWLPGQADGAIPNGARIRKAHSQSGDVTPIGTEGVVVASHYMDPDLLEHARGSTDAYIPETTYLYFVVWDIPPQVPVGVSDWKIEEVT